MGISPCKATDAWSREYTAPHTAAPSTSPSNAADTIDNPTNTIAATSTKPKPTNLIISIINISRITIRLVQGTNNKLTRRI